MRIAVIGAGAMGTLASILFCDAGQEVFVYELRRERASDIASNGVRARGDLSGTAFPSVARTGEPADPYDVIVLATGANESGAALRPLSPFVHRDTVYLSLQEGGAISSLAELVGEERSFAGLAWVSACEAADGAVEVEAFRSLVLGAALPGRESALAGLVEAVDGARAGIVTLSGDLYGEIWKRLEGAAAVSGLCAISGLPSLEARRLEPLNHLCEEAAAECRRAAESGGREDAEPLAPWDGAVWAGLRPPMLRDIEAGRKTEIDCLSGWIVQKARAKGVAVPTHSSILTLVREVEAGRHRPGEAALKELQRRVSEEKGMSLL
ncbi:MAG: ketopantoate reductase C-terminal domain-containing protein [Actinomycetota bacterium]